MSSIIAESYINKTRLPGASQINSNLKKYFDPLLSSYVFDLYKVKMIKNNLKNKEVGTDILNSFKYKEGFTKLLGKYGYSETTEEDYVYGNFNYAEIDNIEWFPELSEMTTEFQYDNGSEEVTLSYFLKDNLLGFYSVDAQKLELYYEFADCDMKDFKIDNNRFLHMYYTAGDKGYYAVSHLGLNFANIGDNSRLNASGLIINIEVPNNLGRIFGVDDCNVYFIDSENNKSICKLSKRYYFKIDNSVYFNLTDEICEYSNNFEHNNNVQAEHLFLYELVNIYGLNDFVDEGGNKISSLYMDAFKKIFKFKFDNTINGGLNFFDFRKPVKSYRVEEKDYEWSVYGNFVHKFKQGMYKIEVDIPKLERDEEPEYVIARLFSKYNASDDNYTLTKDVKLSVADRSFYFCNLKFSLLNFEYEGMTKKILVDVFDEYSFYEKEQTVIIDSFDDEDKDLIGSMYSSADSINQGVQTPIPSFDGFKLSFKNIFDYSKMQFSFASKKLNLTAPFKKFKIKDGISYVVTGPHDVKGDTVISRGNCTVYYTEKPCEDFSLVNIRGFISKLWINNQNKTVYFKLADDGVEITKKKDSSFCKCFFPNISDFFVSSWNSFGKVEIVENDDNEICLDNADGILATEIFRNKPLFYKFYVDSIEELKLYDSDHAEVADVQLEVFGDGYFVYFNQELNKSYYYNSSSEKFQYITPMKAYENFSKDIILENNKAEFGSTAFEFFSLATNADVVKGDEFELFLYNDENKSVYNLTLDSDDIGKAFEVNIKANRATLKIKNKRSAYTSATFVLRSISNNSLVAGDKLVIYKSASDKTLYLSTEREAVDTRTLSLEKIKVQTKYKSVNSKLGEDDDDGTFYVRKPNWYEVTFSSTKKKPVYVAKVLKFISDVASDFYEINFKNPGTIYEPNVGVEQKLSEQHNELIHNFNPYVVLKPFKLTEFFEENSEDGFDSGRLT